MIQNTSTKSYTEEKNKGLGRRQAIVLEVIRERGPVTDKEIASKLLIQDPNGIRPRRFELAKAGLIESIGKKKCAITGKTSLAWVVKRRDPVVQLDLI
jgi:predicted HTH transcriptional regulator